MPELLITTNGFKGTWPAIEYGAWLAATLQTKITLLGVIEKLNPALVDDHHPLEDVFAHATELFRQKGVEYDTEVQRGNAEEVIPRRANTGDFITVVGRLGRPQIRRWLVGRSIRHFMATIRGPILYVPKLRLPLKKMLICVGGLGYEVAAENLAFQIAMKSNSEVTLLHVVSRMNLNYPASRAERENWDHLVDTNTIPGHSLRKALEIAQSIGVKASLTARQGKVGEEILDEIQHGNYDLICMGSPYSANIMRQLYTPNITADIAEAVGYPVLTARHKP
jgi:Universal stress protein UspA and related nucleotide-binding proteins